MKKSKTFVIAIEETTAQEFEIVADTVEKAMEMCFCKSKFHA